MIILEAGTSLMWFGGAALVFVILVVISGGWRKSVPDRLADLSVGDGAGKHEHPLDRRARRRLIQEEHRHKLRERMMQAGFYGTVSGSLFMFFRVLLIASGAGLGFLMSRFGGVLTLTQGLLAGTVCGVAATLAPGFWLDRLKGKRQIHIRRSLPDALDVLVVCLQGGLSVMSALSRVARELGSAHPLLAVEIKIAERQMQMGQGAGEAIRGIADRFDLEELRGMASVVKQAERVGSSVASALEVFAETLRLKRQQQAEEMAAKAAIKMLFPTLLCIFPAIFVVILGPAAISIYQKFILRS